MSIIPWVRHQCNGIRNGLAGRLRFWICSLAWHQHMIIRHVHARTLKPLLTRLQRLVRCVVMSDSLSDIAARKQEKDTVRFSDFRCVL
jgi:hypothetical protein